MKSSLLLASTMAALAACGANPSAVGPLNDGAMMGGGGDGGYGGSTGSAGAAGNAGAPMCDVMSQIAGIAVSSVDVYGWTSYSLDGCRLLYVAAPAAGATNGVLKLRDLTSGSETDIATADEAPRRPSLHGATLAWEATIAGVSQVRVKDGDAAPTTLSGAFDHAGEPRVGGAGVAFTGWLTAADLGDTDVFLRDASGAITAVATGPGQQRWADVSDTHVAWSDFHEDMDGTFNDNETDVCDVGLFELATGMASLHSKPGKQGYPMLGSSKNIVFLEWPPDHPEPKNEQFQIVAWPYASGGNDVPIALVNHPDTNYARPATRNGSVVWVSGTLDSQLLFASVSGGAPVTAMTSASGLRAPVLGEALVVVAGMGASSPGLALLSVATPALPQLLLRPR